MHDFFKIGGKLGSMGPISIGYPRVLGFRKKFISETGRWCEGCLHRDLELGSTDISLKTVLSKITKNLTFGTEAFVFHQHGLGLIIVVAFYLITTSIVIMALFMVHTIKEYIKNVFMCAERNKHEKEVVMIHTNGIKLAINLEKSSFSLETLKNNEVFLLRFYMDVV